MARAGLSYFADPGRQIEEACFNMQIKMQIMHPPSPSPFCRPPPPLPRRRTLSPLSRRIARDRHPSSCGPRDKDAITRRSSFSLSFVEPSTVAFPFFLFHSLSIRHMHRLAMRFQSDTQAIRSDAINSLVVFIIPHLSSGKRK